MRDSIRVRTKSGLVCFGRGLSDKAVAGFVFVTHFLSDRAYLTAVQVGNLVRSLALGGTHHGVEHEFDVRLLPEDARDDLEPPAHFDEPATIQEKQGHMC